MLANSRHVRVQIDGQILADTSSPRLLFETGLPVRYYLPRPHGRMDVLVASGVAWIYRAPFCDGQKIAGLLAFYPEKAELHVDDIRQRHYKMETLRVGQPFPELQARAVRGGTMHIPAELHDRSAVLLFYRGHW
ncbi:MAG: DUF427 domain-containing protein [Gemmatimonadota bacterium]